jgi:hypothetical protein
MNRLITLFLVIITFACGASHKEKKYIETKQEAKISAHSEDSLPPLVQRLMSIYKEIIGFEENHLVFSNNTRILFDDKRNKNSEELLNNPDVEDVFLWNYDVSIDGTQITSDPGRIRNEPFLKALYGNSMQNVRKNLKPLNWCPKLVNQTILFNTKCGAYDSLKKISSELDKHPEWKNYLTNIGGTFNWRVISGTKRLSPHSFGITIDINTTFSNYWQWDCGCKNEDAALKYKNRIPMGIVEIFEKYGFIWGGRWKHYDTMHFEYRPEFFVK